MCLWRLLQRQSPTVARMSFHLPKGGTRRGSGAERDSDVEGEQS